MSRLAEFRKLEQQLAEQLAELESMKSDSALKKEMEFESKLRALLGEYGFSLKNFTAPSQNARNATPNTNGTAMLRSRLAKVIISDLQLRELLQRLHDLHVCREVLHGPQ